MIVTGRMSNCVVVDKPMESVTVKYTRYQTSSEVSPTVGIVKSSDDTSPVGGMNGWACVSCWKSTCHTNRLADNVPSVASVPVPTI